MLHHQSRAPLDHKTAFSKQAENILSKQKKWYLLTMGKSTSYKKGEIPAQMVWNKSESLHWEAKLLHKRADNRRSTYN